MEKKSKRNIFIILSTIFVLVFSLLSYSLFFKYANFYRPFSVTIVCDKPIDYSQLSVTKVSPRFKENITYFDEGSSTFYSAYYEHLNDIVLNIPDSLLSNISKAYITIGKNIYNLNLDNKDCEKQSHFNSITTYKVSELIDYESNMLFCMFSVFLWGGFIRYVYIIVLVVLLFFTTKLLKIKKLTVFMVKKANVLLNFLGRKTADKKFRIILVSLLFSILSIYYLNKIQFSNPSFSWENLTYHSMGVNQAYGHGFSRLGELEDFEKYKFEGYGLNIVYNYKLFNRYSGLAFYFFPPGYGMFLGSVYSIFGVNIKLVKIIQLLMLIVIASSLPLIGYKYWKSIGFYSGIIASIIFLDKTYYMADQLLPEPFLCFLCFLIFLSLEWFFRKKSIISAIGLGFVMSISLLTKYAIILMPLVFFVFVIIDLIKKFKIKLFWNLLIFTFSFIAPIALWAVYTYSHSNQKYFPKENSESFYYSLIEDNLTYEESKFILPILEIHPEYDDMSTIIFDSGHEDTRGGYNILTTRLVGDFLFEKKLVFIASQTGSNAVLYAHNEYIKNGGVSGLCKYDPNSYYNNDTWKDKPNLLRIMKFYVSNPLKIFDLPAQKIYRAFSNNTIFNLFVFSFIISFLIILLYKYIKRRSLVLILAPCLGFLIIYLVLLPYPYVLYVSVFICALILYVINVFKNYIVFRLPKALEIMFISQLLLIISFIGEERFVEILYFMFALIGIYYFLNYMYSSLKKVKLFC